MRNNLKFPLFVFAILLTLGFIGFVLQENPAVNNPILDPATSHLIDHTLDKWYDSIKFFSMGYSSSDSVSENPFLDAARFGSALLVLITLLLAFDFFIPDNWRVFISVWRGDHIVVCGAGTKGSTIVRKRLREQKGKRTVIVIEKDKNNENVLALKDEGALVVFGDAKQEQILKKCKIGIAHSIHIYVNDDSSALSIFDTVKKLHEKPVEKESKTEPVHLLDHVKMAMGWLHAELHRIWSQRIVYHDRCKCFVNILNSEICLGLKNSYSGSEDNYPRLKVYIINTDFVIGEALFSAYKDQELDFTTLNKQNIFIVGTGSIVEYFIINFLHSLYLIKSNKTHGIHRSDPEVPTIAIIDPNAEEYIKYLKNRYPFLDEKRVVFEGSFAFSVKSDKFLELITLQGTANLFVVCLPDDYLSIEAGLLIDEGLKRNEKIQRKIPVVVKIDEEISLNSTVVQMKYKYSNLRFISVKEKITNSHFPEYDLFSGLTEWARISPEKWSSNTTYGHNYLIDKKTGNSLLYDYFVTPPAPPHKDDYPDYLLNIADPKEPVMNPHLEKFLVAPDEEILISKPTFFDEYWKKIEDSLHFSPVEFYASHPVSTETQIRVAKLFVMQGIYDEAQKIVDRISWSHETYNLDFYKSSSEKLDSHILDFLLLKAKIYQNNGEIAEARTIYSDLSGRGTSAEDDTFISQLLKINDVINCEDNHKAIETLNTVISDCTKLQGKRFAELSMICHNMIGKRYMVLNQFDRAIASFETVESSATRNLDMKAITIAYNNLGLGYTAKANNEKDPDFRENYFGIALKYHKDQDKLSKNISYKKGKQRAWGNSAIVHRMRGNLQEAYDNHLMEEKECKNMGYALGLASAYNNLAIIQILSKNKGSPRQNLNKQLILAHKLNETENKALCYGNYALFCYKKNQIYRALLFNEMAIRLSTKDKTYLSFVKILKKIIDLPLENQGKDPKNIDDFNGIIESISDNGIEPGSKTAEFIHAYYVSTQLQIQRNTIASIDSYGPEIKKIAAQLVESDFYLLFHTKTTYETVDEDQAKALFEGFSEYPETEKVFERIFDKAQKNKEIFLSRLHEGDESVTRNSKTIVLSVFDDLTPAPIIR